MLILITPENDVENEIAIVNAIFEAGLEVLHVRKPNKNYAQHMAYLSGIEERFHSKIMLHYEHDLAEDFMLKGVHVQEEPRVEFGEDFGLYVTRFTSQGYDVSTSFHEAYEIVLYKEVPLIYNLLSPVFKAISKPGMLGRAFDVNAINLPVIGMGGVSENNIDVVKKLGYTGVGVLGGVWSNSEPVEAFKKLLKITNEVYL